MRGCGSEPDGYQCRGRYRLLRVIVLTVSLKREATLIAHVLGNATSMSAAPAQPYGGSTVCPSLERGAKADRATYSRTAIRITVQYWYRSHNATMTI
jgi:hypothetical protein